MHYVYIIQSRKYTDEIYKGYTTDLKTRMKQHNSGDTKYSSSFRPWKLIFYSGFVEKMTALNFEKYLKTASGIAFMRKRLLNK